jgi:hypothetical protein
MVEMAPQLSPYRYGFNNPVNVTDPDGNFEYTDGYGTYSSFAATGAVEFSGAYSLEGKEAGCPPHCGGDPSTPWNGNMPSKPLGETFLSQGRSTVYRPEVDQAVQLGIEIAGLVESPFLLWKSGLKMVKSLKGWIGVGEATKGGVNLAIRTDIVLSGGRSGQLVKTLTGPANSVVKGGQGRIFITDDAGKVIWDVTKDRAKSVIPGQGFGPKVSPTQEQLNLLKQVWGN